MPLRTERLTTLEALEALRPEWSELWNRTARATPFQSPEWLLPWMRHIFGGGEIRVGATRDASGKLIGFAPLFRWGLEHRTLSFLGAGISDYGDVLGDAPLAEAETLDLQEIPSDSPLLQNTNAQPCSVCPVLRLSDYPATLDPKHRTDLRRARNKLEKSHTFRFEIADASTLPELLAAFFRLHNARYHSLTPTLEAFHTEAAAEFLAVNRLRLNALFIDGKVAAVIYAFTAHRTLYFYLSGFDPSLAKLSPGALLIQHALEQAIAEGLQYADFLRDPEPYKYLWGARDRINYRLQLSRPETPAAAARAQPASSPQTSPPQSHKQIA